MKQPVKKRTVILLCLLVSFLCALLCSKTSPLYALQDWVDANAYMTMARGWMNGLIPFRDLFEQKGPLLYIVHIIGALIHDSSFLGVFVLQVISFTFVLYYAYKIFTLYMDGKKGLRFLPILGLVFFTMACYRFGDSAEEMATPFIMFALYQLFYYLKDKKEIPYKMFLLTGLGAGVLLWTKFTMVGFHFGFMAFFFFYLWLYKKDLKKAILSALTFLGGMAIVSVPILIYFGAHGALKDLFHVYFTINLTAYPVEFTLIERLAWMIRRFIEMLKNNIFYTVLFLPAIVAFLYKEKKSPLSFGVLTTLFFLFFFTFIGGRAYSYYFLVFFSFIVIFPIAISQFNINKLPDSRWILPAIVILCTCLTYYMSSNTDDIKLKKSDYAQYIFADYINNSGKEQSMLYYGDIDAGFYLTTGIVPKTYYFEKLNLPYENYPENVDELNRYIDEEQIQFVIFKDDQYWPFNIYKCPALLTKYHKIMEHEQMFQGKMTTYYLYEKNV